MSDKCPKCADCGEEFEPDELVCLVRRKGMVHERDCSPKHPYPVGGMTLLDWFAGQAIEGWIASLTAEVIDSYDGDEDAFAEHQMAVAKTCYNYADAMLAEKSRRKARRRKTNESNHEE